MIKKNGTVRNCRNFTTWLTFSHRISCLFATQILHTQDTKSRARLLSRFIMVCDKCHQNGNHQSATSVLLGLVSPAIYRLYATWDRVRRFHSTAYRAFKRLCREYKQSPVPDFNRPPYLPSAWFFLDAVFGRTSRSIRADPSRVKIYLTKLLNNFILLLRFASEFGKQLGNFALIIAQNFGTDCFDFTMFAELWRKENLFFRDAATIFHW